MQCVQRGLSLAKSVQNTPMFWAFPLTISYCGLVAKSFGHAALMEEAIAIMQRYLPRFPLTLRMIDILLSSPVTAFPPPLPPSVPSLGPSKLAPLLAPDSPSSQGVVPSSFSMSMAAPITPSDGIFGQSTSASSAFTRNPPRPYGISRTPYALPLEVGGGVTAESSEPSTPTLTVTTPNGNSTLQPPSPSPNMMSPSMTIFGSEALTPNTFVDLYCTF